MSMLGSHSSEELLSLNDDHYTHPLHTAYHAACRDDFDEPRLMVTQRTSQRNTLGGSTSGREMWSYILLREGLSGLALSLLEPVLGCHRILTCTHRYTSDNKHLLEGPPMNRHYGTYKTWIWQIDMSALHPGASTPLTSVCAFQQQ